MENYRKIRKFKRRVLIVDDEMINREILGNILSDDYEVSMAENGQQALDALREEEAQYALILLDLLMPVMDGFELLGKLKADEELKRIPVIVMTSEKAAEVKSIRHGAADFIPKPYDMPEVILARCERIIELSEDKSIIRSAERDNLTGLYTKDFFFEYVRQIESYDPKRAMDVMVLDIAHFHLINELYGRKEGDQILKKMGEALFAVLHRVSGISCRMEADEFCVYYEHSENCEELIDVIREALKDLPHAERIRFRAGIYQNVDKEILPETWFDRAKLACERIRGDYTQQVAYYSKELHERSIYHEQLINEIDEAIEKKHLMVFYQPKYGIQGDKPVLKSAEALIRWKHPERGMLNPGEFIPLFEGNGLIQKLDHFVWREAAAQIAAWKEKYDMTVPVSVNVSRIDIYDPKLEEKLEALLETNRLTPKELMLEITESAYSDDANRLVEVVESLRARGFKIEMDDFGSGYSSLNMLTTIPIDVLKMDMKFVRNMQKDEKSLRLVRIVMDIAKFLKVPVVAEGVEDEAQLRILKDMGCDLIQGYYFSKPVPPEEFEKFIQAEVGNA